MPVEDDRSPSGDGQRGFDVQTDSAVGCGFGLAAEADAPAGSGRGRVPGEDVRIDVKSVATGLPGDADVAGLGPDGLRRGAQPYRPVAGGAGRQAVDDDVAVRRDIVVEKDGAEATDAGHGDLLSGLDRRTRELMDGPAGITERVTRHRHAIGVTANRPTKKKPIGSGGSRPCPPVGIRDRRALPVKHDRTPSPDGRGRDLLEPVVGEITLDRIAVEGDRAAGSRGRQGIQRGDRPAEVEAVAAADIGAGDDDVTDERGHGGAVETNSVDAVDAPGIGDRAAGADDGDVAEGAGDSDIVIADRFDAGTSPRAREPSDRDITRRGDLLGRTVETHAAVAGGGRRAGCGLDDAVDVGRALQRDAAVGRDE